MTEEQQRVMTEKIKSAERIVNEITRTRRTIDSIRSASTISLSEFGFSIASVKVYAPCEDYMREGGYAEIMGYVRRVLLDAYEPHLAKLIAEYEAL